jgi:cbb3-type cytochrome oxidase maturation protein
MNTIFFLIGCSVLLALIFLIAFLWSHKNGQHQDLYTPSVRILMDDEVITTDKNIEKAESK